LWIEKYLENNPKIARFSGIWLFFVAIILILNKMKGRFSYGMLNFMNSLPYEKRLLYKK